MAYMIKNAEEQINFAKASDYGRLMSYLHSMSEKHYSIKLGYLGTSILGRGIPIIYLGKNPMARGVIYVGGARGTDKLTPCALMRFVRDYAEGLETGKRICGVSVPYLYESRMICVVPMLNPDGYDICKYGVGDIPIRDRLIRQNGGEDFSSWRYNARGVDLWKNFCDLDEGADRESERAGISAESEPETSGICSFLRMASGEMVGRLELWLSLGLDGSVMREGSGRQISRMRTVGRLISDMIGCPRETVSGGKEQQRGGPADWFVREMLKPAFDCGCLFDGTVDPSEPDDYLKIYAAFREAFFSCPLLIG